MRLLAAVLLLAPAVAAADSDFPVGPGVQPSGAPPATRKAVEKPADLPFWQAELRIGYGMSRAGTMDSSTIGASPLSLSAIAAIAFSEDPRAYAYGGLTSEMLSRSFVGVTGGARIEMNELPIRLGGGGVWMFAPTTLWGAQASGGSCLGKGALALCGDVQLTAYFGGTGLDNDKTELQVQLVLGIEARGGH